MDHPKGKTHQHFTDHERALYHANAGDCPANLLDACTAKPAEGKCMEPEGCPMWYWLKATGLLKLGVYPVVLPKTPPAQISASGGGINHNNRLNGAGN